MEEEIKRQAIAKKELSDEDWKTQLARGYSNIPKGAIVDVIKENVVNFYGIWTLVKWNGNHYYVNRDSLEEISIADKMFEELGYKKEQDNDYKIVYLERVECKDPRDNYFNRITILKSLNSVAKSDCGNGYITFEELKAINKKFEEME